MNKIIGVKVVDYDKVLENGEKVHKSGVELVYTFPSKNYDGENADRQYIPMNIINEKMDGIIPGVGEKGEFTYGRSRDGRAYVNGWIQHG